MKILASSGILSEQVLPYLTEPANSLGSLNCKLLQNGSGQLLVSCYGLALEFLVEFMGLFARHALRIAVEVHPLHYLLVLLLQVTRQEFSDDCPPLVLNLADGPVFDLKHPPDEPSVHLLSLCESLRHCVQYDLLAFPVGLATL